VVRAVTIARYLDSGEDEPTRISEAPRSIASHILGRCRALDFARVFF